MRQIGFRGKSQYGEHKWIYGLLVKTASGCVYIAPYGWDGRGLQKYRVIPETVSQYTGYNDKDGNYIYDGDILSVNIGDIDVVMRVVFMYGGWKIHERYNDMLNDLCSSVEYGDVRVIGNITDTPELFEP